MQILLESRTNAEAVKGDTVIVIRCGFKWPRAIIQIFL
jgi:hypothetical protein